MRRSCSLWQGATMHLFRPHLHKEGCAMCAAAASRQRRGASASPSIDPLSTTANTTFPLPQICAEESQANAGSSAPLSVIEHRRNALQKWLSEFSGERRCDGRGNTDPICQGRCLPVLNSIDQFDAAYEAYLSCDNPDAQQALFIQLAKSLDAQCGHSNKYVASESRAVPHSHQGSTMPAEDTSLRLPRTLAIPQTTTLPARTVSGVTTPSGVSTNLFADRIRERFGDDAAAARKQLAFQEALLGMQGILIRQGIPFFLACGTALGARRDDCFIPHDEDIDLGIFYDILARPTAEHGETPANHALSTDFAVPGLHRAQQRVFDLLNAVATHDAYVVLDICGAMEKGLELRVLHVASGVRVDLNVYYPPILTGDGGDDAALVEQKGPFVWASSFYENAGDRKHSMYRYLHKPFAADLQRLPFCVETVHAPGFWVPPVRYLEESYGVDWRTPKKFSYTEGLAAEFKNILPE